MLDELTRELLDLTVTEKGYGRARYAVKLPVCACCSCCTCLYDCNN